MNFLLIPMATGNSLCCTLRREAWCLDCSWAICEECWDIFCRELKPNYAAKQSAVDSVHNIAMKGICYMPEDIVRGIHFERSEY